MDETERDPEPDAEPEPRPGGERSPDAGGRRRPAEVDVEKLADKVYRLMLAEVRLERARGRPAALHGKR